MLITDCQDAHRHLADCAKNCAANCGGGCKEHKHCTACNAILCHRGLWRPIPDAPFNPGSAASAHAEMVRAQSEANRWRDLWEQAKTKEAEMKAAREQALQELEDRRAAAFQKVSEAWADFLLTISGPARATAILHQPERGDQERIWCAHCLEMDSDGYAQRVEWPCETYKVMKEAV